MNYKKVVSCCISSITAFTAFLYCFRVPVYADEHYILGNDEYLIETFLNMGFTQQQITDTRNISESYSFSGSIDQNGTFTISMNNVQGNYTGTQDIDLGDISTGLGAGVGYAHATLSNGSMTCTPRFYSQNNDDEYVCSVPSQGLTYDTIQLSGYAMDNGITAYSGSLNGTNLNFTLNNLTGAVSGTISDNVVLTLPWLIPPTGTVNQIRFNKYTINENLVSTSTEKNIYIVCYVHTDSFNSSKMDLFKYGTTSTNQNSNFSKSYGNVMQPNANKPYSGYVVYYTDGTLNTNTYIKPNTVQGSFDSTLKVIPLYIGWGLYAPDNIRSIIGMFKKTDSLLMLGNTESTDKKSRADAAGISLQTARSDLTTLEDQFINDFSSDLNNIQISNDLVSNNGFINASQWIANQYSNIVTANPINNMIMFSLILGLAMVMIGKVRK